MSTASAGPDSGAPGIIEQMDSLAEFISSARPRALGGGVIIDRARASELILAARAAIPDAIRAAKDVVSRRDEIIAAAADEGKTILAAARDERDRLLAEHEVTLVAHQKADEILAAASRESANKRAEVDAYVDGKLAAFEATLSQTLEAIAHGRRRLADRAESGER
ncbi:MAG: hypothetical protein U0904_02265 [Candidatus Nanopelagicales bacterium]|nr:hypothetical protein [Candidatus Nanopelagicales bacterium]